MVKFLSFVSNIMKKNPGVFKSITEGSKDPEVQQLFREANGKLPKQKKRKSSKKKVVVKKKIKIKVKPIGNRRRKKIVFEEKIEVKPKKNGRRRKVEIIEKVEVRPKKRGRPKLKVRKRRRRKNNPNNPNKEVIAKIAKSLDKAKTFKEVSGVLGEIMFQQNRLIDEISKFENSSPSTTEAGKEKDRLTIKRFDEVEPLLNKLSKKAKTKGKKVTPKMSIKDVVAEIKKKFKGDKLATALSLLVEDKIPEFGTDLEQFIFKDLDKLHVGKIKLFAQKISGADATFVAKILESF